jgi:hypothetical protein
MRVTENSDRHIVLTREEFRLLKRGELIQLERDDGIIHLGTPTVMEFPDTGPEESHRVHWTSLVFVPDQPPREVIWKASIEPLAAPAPSGLPKGESCPQIRTAVNAFIATLPPPPYEISYENDTGPDDEGYWQWWEVAGIKFDTEAQATAFLEILNTK